MDRLMGVVLAVLVTLAGWGCSSSDGGPTGASSPDGGSSVADGAVTDTGSQPSQDSATDVAQPIADGGTADAIDAATAPEVSMTGSFGGAAFTPVGARGTRYAIGQNEVMRVAIYDQVPTCGSVNAGHFPPGVKVFALDVYAGGSGPTHVTAGTYSLVAGNDGGLSQVSFSLQERDQGCQLQQLLNVDPSKDSGSVTIDAIDDARVRGTFTLTVGGKAVSGTFDTSFCPATEHDAGAGSC